MDQTITNTIKDLRPSPSRAAGRRVSGAFRPMSPRTVAGNLALSLGCSGPDYSYFRSSLANGLGAMSGPATRFSSTSSGEIAKLLTLFQKATGISRAKVHGEYNGNYADQYITARDEWIRINNVRNDVLASLLKTMARPCTNDEIEARLKKCGADLARVLSTPQFYSFIDTQPNELALAGSLATGNFGGFSDVDLIVSQDNVAAHVFEGLKEACRDSGVDLFHDLTLERRKAIWLSKLEVQTFRLLPDFLCQFYLIRNLGRNG